MALPLYGSDVPPPLPDGYSDYAQSFQQFGLQGNGSKLPTSLSPDQWLANNSPTAYNSNNPNSFRFQTTPTSLGNNMADTFNMSNTTPTSMVTNPLSQYNVTPTTNSPAVPNLGVTASSPSTGSFSQGAPLPNITTTQSQATAAPQFYTDYLSQLAQQGKQAAQSAQYVGAQPLQEQAFSQVGQNVGNYQPTLQNAINLASGVGNSNLAEAVGNLGNANIARNLAPQATSGIVGSGQFGSTRGAQALGDTLANASLGVTAQQAQALQQDYQNRLASSQQLGNLASQTQALGLGDVNALATMGGQQQTIGQNGQLFPMQQLMNESSLLKNYTMPTSSSSSYTGPIPGAYAASPLQQIAGLGALGAGISNTELGKTLFGTADTVDPKTGAVIKGAPSFIGKGLGSFLSLFGPSQATISGQNPAYNNMTGLTGNESTNLDYFNNNPTDVSYLNDY